MDKEVEIKKFPFGDFLLLKKNAISNRIYIELTGMSVRAFTSLTVSVQKHRNPTCCRCLCTVIFTPDYGRGAVGYILKSNGITELLIVNTPTVIFCDGFVYGVQ